MSNLVFNTSTLQAAGLKLSAVFDLDSLPKPLSAQIQALVPKHKQYRQAILIAHAGNKFWQQIKNSAGSNDYSQPLDELQHPIDDYSINLVKAHFKTFYPSVDYQIVYPNSADFDQPVGLQQFGQLAGWHHGSPLKVGINAQWGTWFAYRLLLLSDTDFIPTEVSQSQSPCLSCADKPCISRCPADAVSVNKFNLQACVTYRQSKNSMCQDRCVARMACPVAQQHQYSLEQIQYHYGRSMQVIKRFYPQGN